MVEFLPFYFFYLLLFQLSSVDMYISTKNINIRIFSTVIDFHYIQSLQLLTLRSHTP